MKNTRPLLLVVLLAFLIVPGSAFGQQQVSGTVRDASSADPLPGVNIVIKGTDRGVASDIDGHYRLNVSSATDTLVFSFVGFITQQVAVGGRTQLDVNLEPETLTGEEIVVVGYGTQRKVDLTGSVAIADANQIRQSYSTTLLGALQGTASGVSVKSSGAPGESPEVRIRGINTFGNAEPLYVVDGVPVDNISDFNLSDMESIQILKDAAAASIYGSRAAKGVVIITTKRGGKGSSEKGLSVQYDASIGTSYIYQRYDVLNRVEYQTFLNAEMAAAGRAPLAGNDPSSPYYIDDIDTDWQESAFEPGMLSSNNITVSGGNNISNYSISGGYESQEGSFNGPSPFYDRYSVRVNSDHKLGRLTFGESAYYAKTNTNRQESRHEVSLINNTLKALPTMRIYDVNRLGGYGGVDSNIEGAITLNTIGVNHLLKSHDDANRFLVNLWGQFELINGLNYKLNFSYDTRSSEDFLFVPRYDLGYFFTEQNGNLTVLERSRNYTVIENTLNYQKNFGAHHLNLLGGITQEVYHYHHTGGYAEGYASDDFLTLEAASGTKTAYDFKTNWALQSQLGRITYDYAGKYLMTASVRRDGSSRFAEDNRWGVFPSISVGWRVSQEQFFQNKLINDLKIRGSYGELGNQDLVSDYPFSAFVNNYANYNFGGNLAIGNIPVALANRDITWETAKSFDVGVDFTMLDARLRGTFDYYNNKTVDILLQQAVPQTTGSTENPYVNSASMRNKGLEFQLTWEDKVGEIGYELTGNLTTWNNEVLALGTLNQPIYSFASKTDIGHSVGEIYGFETDGLFQSDGEVCKDATGVTCLANGTAYQMPGTAAGDIRFKDLNYTCHDADYANGTCAADQDIIYGRSDGIVNDDDRNYLGKSIPDFFYGINAKFTYKAFDLNLFVQGTYGNKIFNNQRATLENMAGWDNQTTAVLDAWTPTNTDTDIPRAIYGDPNNNARASDRWVESGSYLRLQDITLGYTLPARLISRIGVSSLRVYVSAQNVATITGYSGLDPDLGDDGDEVDNDEPLSRGFDGGAWPHPRIFRTGVQLRF